MLDLAHLVVAPAPHRRGVGSALVRRVLDHAGPRPTVVATGRDDRPARTLYERLGSTATGQHEVLPGLRITGYEHVPPVSDASPGTLPRSSEPTSTGPGPARSAAAPSGQRPWRFHRREAGIHSRRVDASKGQAPRPPPNREEPNAMTTQWLINGVFQASTLIVVVWALSRWTRDIVARALLAFLLCGAALTYVYFAAKAGEGTGWVIAELAGVAVYGSLALRGLSGSPLWLAAGWALHPVWDVALHYSGPGHAFAPDAFAITCLSFDLLVATYIAVAYRYGLVGRRGRTPTLPATDPAPAPTH